MSRQSTFAGDPSLSTMLTLLVALIVVVTGTVTVVAQESVPVYERVSSGLPNLVLRVHVLVEISGRFTMIGESSKGSHRVAGSPCTAHLTL
jgi:hypothetical protein